MSAPDWRLFIHLVTSLRRVPKRSPEPFVHIARDLAFTLFEMDQRWKTCVHPILSALVEILIPLSLIDRLLEVKLITIPEYERLSHDSIDDEKRSRQLLVSILPRKGPDSFDRLLNVLKETKGQEHVARKLLGEEEKREQKRKVE